MPDEKQETRERLGARSDRYPGMRGFTNFYTRRKHATRTHLERSRDDDERRERIDRSRDEFNSSKSEGAAAGNSRGFLGRAGQRSFA